jgi:hypothetical protein
MDIFSSKLKIDMETYCEGFYNSQLFHFPINGKDCSNVLFDNLFNSYSGADPVFSQVERPIFEFEFISLYIELFSLAFLDYFHDFNNGVKNSMFTHKYLLSRNRLDIWENMSKYNLLLADTAYMLPDGNLSDPNSRLGRITISGVNNVRQNLFEDYLKEHLIDINFIADKDNALIICIKRVCNRFAASISSNNQVGARKLTAIFMQSFRKYFNDAYQPEKELLQKISSTTLTLYKSFKTTLKEVDLQF